MSSCHHLQCEILGGSATVVLVNIHSLNGADLSVLLASNKVDAKLWAAAIAVILCIPERCVVLAIDTEFHGDLLSPRRGI
jgi:hypothetical protein